MNRRSFLKSAGTAAALAAGDAMILAPRMKAQTSSPNLSLYNASGAAHAIASGNYDYATPTANDWNTIHNTLQNVITDWQNNNLDSQVKAALPKISASMITSASLPQQSILSGIKAYQPSFTLANVQQALGYIDQQSASIPGVMQTMEQDGMSYYIDALLTQSTKIANLLSSGSSSASSRFGANPDYLPTPPPSSGYNCETDGAAVFFAGIAFAVLTFMSAGTDAVLAGAAWEGISVWGGFGATGWGIGHAVAGCGF